MITKHRIGADMLFIDAQYEVSVEWYKKTTLQFYKLRKN